MNIEWDARRYSQDFRFVHQYGEDVLNLLAIEKGMRVLDLGCGDGTLTRKMADMGAEAFGMDASEEMLALAREKYPTLSFLKGDATDFGLSEPVDAVFSNAVFHWVNDQERLLQNVARAIKPGGHLVCEFGGKGCAETVHSTLERSFQRRGLTYKRTFYFPTIGQYAPLLEDQGFKVQYAALFDRMTKLAGEDGMRDWIGMFIKEPFQGVSAQDAGAIVAETIDHLGPHLYREDAWYVDYVRIRLKAVVSNPGRTVRAKRA